MRYRTLNDLAHYIISSLSTRTILPKFILSQVNVHGDDIPTPRTLKQLHVMQVRALIVGLGHHARRVYLPAFSAPGLRAKLVLGVDLKSQEKSIDSFLKEKGFSGMEMVYVEAFNVLCWTRNLPPAVDQLLTSEIQRLRINAMVISADPLVHMVYALWGLQRGLHILMDKPISTRLDAACSVEAARGIWADFEELVRVQEVKLALGQSLIVSVAAQRRYHEGFQYVCDLIEEVSSEYQQPVTNIQSYHSDGQLRLPEEMKNITYHSFNQGHGKISHSGYHFIDMLVEFYKAGTKSIRDPQKVASRASVSCVGVRPQSVFRLQTHEDWSRVLPGYHEQLKYEARNLMAEFQGSYGEVDAQIQVVFQDENMEPLALGNINLIHNGFSRRCWLEPSVDLYKKNGRVKHELHIIQQGPYQCIHIHSYQANDNHDNQVPADEAFSVGGDMHFDIIIFRNVGIFRNKLQPVMRKVSLEQILALNRGTSLSTGLDGQSSLKLPSEVAKQHLVNEFVCAVGSGERCKLLSELHSHADAVRLMSCAYESLAVRKLGDRAISPEVSLPLTMSRSTTKEFPGKIYMT